MKPCLQFRCPCFQVVILTSDAVLDSAWLSEVMWWLKEERPDPQVHQHYPILQERYEIISIQDLFCMARIPVRT